MELEDFETKINNITEQFMSLLDSNDVIESSVTNKFESIPKAYDEKCKEGPAIFNAPTINYGNTPAFKLGTEGIHFGGISYSNETINQDELPKHAVRFDSVEQMELNKELEKLYQDKRKDTNEGFQTKPNIAFSDSNLSGINRFGGSINDEYTKFQTSSTLNDKEVYDMSNYAGEEKKENVFYSFATIPAEKSLVEKKDWKDMLFMDIPWDTKVDVWGGIKKFCTIQVKFTA